jgi:hypothetical protein
MTMNRMIRLRNVVVLLIAGLVILWIVVAQPSSSTNQRSLRKVPTDQLKAHVKALSEKYAPRSYTNITNLDFCADYIAGQFRLAGANVMTQEYEVEGRKYRNIRGIFGDESKARIIMGAHYDAFGIFPAADDNASGVAGIIELAYLLGREKPAGCYELVAYTLEEPPFFRSKSMGSYQHAQLMKEQGIKIKAMISVEMIGYFSDEKWSQKYPIPLLYLYYPDKGDFIGVISDFSNVGLTRRVKALMKGSTGLPVYSITAPRLLPGIDLSDHRNYWRFDIPAIMVSDTAFYRNRQYHHAGDTYDRLDYQRMADVVIGIYEAAVGLNR